MFIACLRAALPILIGMAPAAAQERPPFPWHLVDIGWKLPIGQSTPFKSFSIDVNISADIDSSNNIYIAAMEGNIGNKEFYDGIQVLANGREKESSHIAKCRLPMGSYRAIFSEFGERSVTAMKVQSPDGTCDSSGSEGDYISVRRPFFWKKGRYTITLAVLQHAPEGERWIAMDIRDETGKSSRIGALRFPAGTDFRPSIASFVEVFAPSVDPKVVPRFTASFGNLHFNGQPIQPTAAWVCYPSSVPSYAEAVSTGSGAVSVTVDDLHDRSGLPRTALSYVKSFAWSGAAPECP